MWEGRRGDGEWGDLEEGVGRGGMSNCGFLIRGRSRGIKRTWRRVSLKGWAARLILGGGGLGGE